MGLGRIFSNVIASAATDARQLPGVAQQTQSAGTQPTLAQADERLAQLAAQSAQTQEPSPIEAALHNPALGTDYDALLSVELPAGALTKEGYDREFVRAGLQAAGAHDLTDGEVAVFQARCRRTSGEPFRLAATKEQLDTSRRGGGNRLKVAVNERARAIFQAGAEQINRSRSEQTARSEQARVAARQYGDDALQGWVSLHADSAVNVFNGATEPLRGVSNLVFGVEIPEAPRLGWHHQSEYWRQGGGGQAAEVAGTLAAGALVGGVGLRTTIGKAVAGADAAYNSRPGRPAWTRLTATRRRRAGIVRRGRASARCALWAAWSPRRV